MLEKIINICDECKSKYYKDSSTMDSLCPNCASILYDIPNCIHQFEDGRCIKCFWNGTVSTYLEKLSKNINMKK